MSSRKKTIHWSISDTRCNPILYCNKKKRATSENSARAFWWEQVTCKKCIKGLEANHYHKKELGRTVA
jgi:hypothetical protein